MQKFRIENSDRPLKNSLVVVGCDTFLSQLRGLMFKPNIPVDEGLLFLGKQENKIDSSIHMFFMKFDITVIWLNTQYQVVDIQLARRWPPIYVPRQPAKFFLEIHSSRFSDFQIGDHLVMEHA